MGNDYQNQMSKGVLKADQAGNASADKFGTMTAEVPGSLEKWGMLPGVTMPMDHVYARQEFFRGEVERTLRDGHNVPLMSRESIKESGALKTQQKMLNNYIMDGQILPGAAMQFNTFAPLANMAAKSAVKTDEIGTQLGLTTNDKIGEVLDPAHAAALKKSVIASEKSGALGRGISVTTAQQAVLTKRNLFMAATHDIASFMTKDVVAKLRGTIDETQKEKAEIYEKIERVQKIGEVIEVTGSLMAGGAGAFEAATAHEMAGKIGGAGDAAETGGGIIGGLAGGIAKLYYAPKLTELEATITRASGEITGWNLAAEAGQLMAKKLTVTAAANDYREAVKHYEDAMNDRRMAYASMGAEADNTVNKGKPAKKQDQVDSATMLWIESLQETKSFIDGASEAGNQAKTIMDDISHQVMGHRIMGWTNIEDIWGSNSMRNEDGGGEIHALSTMRRLTDSWIKGAGVLKTRLDGAVGSADAKEDGAAGTMAKSGYTGQF